MMQYYICLLSILKFVVVHSNNGVLIFIEDASALVKLDGVLFKI